MDNITSKIIKVTIPAGIDNGQVIRLIGCGEPGVNGGDRGDMLVKIIVQKHPILKRKGLNIFSTVAIDYKTAVFGGEIKVKTCYNDVLLKIKAGTKNNTMLRLKGKGVSSPKNPKQIGNHYVTILVKLPTSTNENKK